MQTGKLVSILIKRPQLEIFYKSWNFNCGLMVTEILGIFSIFFWIFWSVGDAINMKLCLKLKIAVTSICITSFRSDWNFFLKNSNGHVHGDLSQIMHINEIKQPTLIKFVRSFLSRVMVFYARSDGRTELNLRTDYYQWVKHFLLRPFPGLKF